MAPSTSEWPVQRRKKQEEEELRDRIEQVQRELVSREEEFRLRYEEKSAEVEALRIRLAEKDQLLEMEERKSQAQSQGILRFLDRFRSSSSQSTQKSPSTTSKSHKVSSTTSKHEANRPTNSIEPTVNVVPAPTPSWMFTRFGSDLTAALEPIEFPVDLTPSSELSLYGISKMQEARSSRQERFLEALRGRVEMVEQPKEGQQTESVDRISTSLQAIRETRRPPIINHDDLMIDGNSLCELIKRSPSVLILDIREHSQLSTSSIVGSLHFSFLVSILENPAFDITNVLRGVGDAKDQLLIQRVLKADYIVVYDYEYSKDDYTYPMAILNGFANAGWKGKGHILMSFNAFAREFPGMVSGNYPGTSPPPHYAVIFHESEQILTPSANSSGATGIQFDKDKRIQQETTQSQEIDIEEMAEFRPQATPSSEVSGNVNTLEHESVSASHNDQGPEPDDQEGSNTDFPKHAKSTSPSEPGKKPATPGLTWKSILHAPTYTRNEWEKIMLMTKEPSTLKRRLASHPKTTTLLEDTELITYFDRIYYRSFNNPKRVNSFKNKMRSMHMRCRPLFEALAFLDSLEEKSSVKGAAMPASRSFEEILANKSFADEKEMLEFFETAGIPAPTTEYFSGGELLGFEFRADEDVNQIHRDLGVPVPEHADLQATAPKQATRRPSLLRLRKQLDQLAWSYGIYSLSDLVVFL